MPPMGARADAFAALGQAGPDLREHLATTDPVETLLQVLELAHERSGRIGCPN